MGNLFSNILKEDVAGKTVNETTDKGLGETVACLPSEIASVLKGHVAPDITTKEVEIVREQCKESAIVSTKKYDGEYEVENTPNVIDLENVTLKFGDFTLFDKLNFSIPDFKGEGQFIAIMGGSGSGKCVSGDTYVRTSDGIRLIKNLVRTRIPDTSEEVNNISVVLSGKEEKISHLYYGGIKPTKIVTLENGEKLEGTLVHPVKVWRNFSEQWIKMADLKIGDCLLKDNNPMTFMTNKRYKLPIYLEKTEKYCKIYRFKQSNKTLKINEVADKLGCPISEIQEALSKYKKDYIGLTPPEYMTNDIAYYLGLLYGDGTIGKHFIGITTCDSYIENFVKNFHKNVLNIGSSVYRNKKSNCVRTVCPLKLGMYRDWLNALGVKVSTADTKCVPDVILNAPFEYQISFVKGLMDTDGYIDKYEYRCGITLNSINLINFTKEVLSALGFSYKISKKGKKAYRLECRKNRNVNVLFDLKRKQYDTSFVFCEHQSHLPIHGSIKYIKEQLTNYNGPLRKEIIVNLENGKDINKSKYIRYQKLFREKYNITLKDLPKYEFIKITDIEDGETEVFDMCNPISHSFIANGFLVHNTQLSRLISGLKRPNEGIIKMYGKPYDEKTHVPMVFQQYSSFPWMTVLENVALPLKMKGVGKEEREAKAMEILKLVGLEGHEQKWAQYPSLSGGQLQRVSLARNLAGDSQIMILDEYSSGLDTASKASMQDILLKLFYDDKVDRTFIMITHDINEAIYLSQRVYLLDAKTHTFGDVVDVKFDGKRDRNIINTPKYQEYYNRIERFFNK